MTYDATRLVDHEKTAFLVVQYDLDGHGCHRRFMPMNDVPGYIDVINMSDHFAANAGIYTLDTVPVPDYCLRFRDLSIDRSDTRFQSVPLRGDWSRSRSWHVKQCAPT